MAIETKYKLANLEQLGLLGTAVKGITDALRTDVNASVKSLVVNGNTVELYTGANGTGTKAGEFNFPKELFLDAAGTTFVPNFTWSSASYPGSTDPSLNGKPVIVLAVRTTTDYQRSGVAGDTINYSFIDVSSLVDTYTVNTANGDTVSSKVLTINGYTVKFNISSATGNGLVANADGLYVDTASKADKVTGATSGNIAGLDANGNLTDSGIAGTDVLLASEYLATNTEATSVINTALGISS